MRIEYQVYSFSLRFDHRLILPPLPAFILRSVMGRELHDLSCMVHKKQECSDCMFRDSCAYSMLFESPVAPDNDVLKGRNFAAHPFVLYAPPAPAHRTDRLQMQLLLLGKANKYLPYFYYAVEKSGRSGLFRERMPFVVEQLECDGNSLLAGDHRINVPDTSRDWQLDSRLKPQTDMKLIIRFETPSRIKEAGKLQSTLGYVGLLRAIFRRLEILSGFYGLSNGYRPNFELLAPKEERANLFWKDFNRYSSRQKTQMKLGGILGHLEVSGSFSPLELSLLKAGELFHAGKNCAFGLGKFSVMAMTNVFQDRAGN